VSGSVAGQQFLGSVSTGKPAHGAPRETKLATDCVDTNAFSEQRVHRGVAFTCPYRPPIGPMSRVKGRWLPGVLTWLFGCRGLADTGAGISIGVDGQSSG